MIDGILNLNKKKNKTSRRDFFKNTASLFCVLSVPTFINAKNIDTASEDEFIIIDGWVLKREDFNDLQPK